MPQNELDFALVVGINDYPRYRPLAGAVSDAHKFAQWVTDQETGGGLPQDNCKLVLSTPDPLQPEHTDIDDALDAILRTARSGGRRFYFYFSGHGLSRSQTNSLLCLTEWAETRNRALDASDYLNCIAAAGVFQEIVFLTDCCRVRVPQARGLPCTIAMPLPKNKAETRFFLAYAAEVFTQAFEDRNEQGEMQGNFTRVLLDGLSGGAADEQGGVTPVKLKEYLNRRLPQLTNFKQKPEVLDGLSESTRFGSALPKPTAVHIRFRPGTDTDTDVVLAGPGGAEIKRGPPGGGWTVELLPGLYLLKIPGTDQDLAFAVNSGAGEINVDF
jgi:uncharacterized caspase-like protein